MVVTPWPFSPNATRARPGTRARDSQQHCGFRPPGPGCYGYDLLGNQTSTGDPDKGTSTMTYDNAGQLLTTTDARGKTVAYTYDNLGRKTGRYDTSTAGTKLVGWRYDTLANGQSTSATRYVGTDAYVTAVTGYDDNSSVAPLVRLINLTSLRLYQARELTSLAGVEQLPRLSGFELAGARKLTDVSALAGAGELRRLDVTSATNVGDWSVLGGLAKLQWLSLEDVKVIDSVDFVLRLPALEKFFATGTTKVADGRVAQLADHPKLRKVALAQASQHDATGDEIQKKLGRFSLF